MQQSFLLISIFLSQRYAAYVEFQNILTYDYVCSPHLNKCSSAVQINEILGWSFSAFNGWNDKEASRWTWTSSHGGTDYFPGAGHFTQVSSTFLCLFHRRCHHQNCIHNYFQVVWAKSDGVGCGFNACSGKMARFICNYSPP